jgi:hypothetical protein
MTIDDMIAELEDIKRRNQEPDVPGFDPGTLEVRIQSEDGTYESEIKSVEQANDVWIIVAEPNYDL